MSDTKTPRRPLLIHINGAERAVLEAIEERDGVSLAQAVRTLIRAEGRRLNLPASGKVQA